MRLEYVQVCDFASNLSSMPLNAAIRDDKAPLLDVTTINIKEQTLNWFALKVYWLQCNLRLILFVR